MHGLQLVRATAKMRKNLQDCRFLSHEVRPEGQQTTELRTNKTNNFSCGE
jgi:hypothetical protein